MAGRGTPARRGSRQGGAILSIRHMSGAATLAGGGDVSGFLSRGYAMGGWGRSRRAGCDGVRGYGNRRFGEFDFRGRVGKHPGFERSSSSRAYLQDEAEFSHSSEPNSRSLCGTCCQRPGSGNAVGGNSRSMRLPSGAIAGLVVDGETDEAVQRAFVSAVFIDERVLTGRGARLPGIVRAHAPKR